MFKSMDKILADGREPSGYYEADKAIKGEGVGSAANLFTAVSRTDFKSEPYCGHNLLVRAAEMQNTLHIRLLRALGAKLVGGELGLIDVLIHVEDRIEDDRMYKICKGLPYDRKAICQIKWELGDALTWKPPVTADALALV